MKLAFLKTEESSQQDWLSNSSVVCKGPLSSVCVCYWCPCGTSKYDLSLTLPTGVLGTWDWSTMHQEQLLKLYKIKPFDKVLQDLGD